MALVFTTSYVEDAKAIFHQYKRLAEGAMAQMADGQLTATADINWLYRLRNFPFENNPTQFQVQEGRPGFPECCTGGANVVVVHSPGGPTLFRVYA